MQTKLCIRCSRPAEFSLAFLLSTVAVRPRLQKCSQSILLCQSCIHDAIHSLGATPLNQLHQPLTNAYTAIANNSGASAYAANQSVSAEEAHQDDADGVSCRPRLIACNSRKFTCQLENSGNSDDR
jgi:hypothetical protein